MHSSAIKTLMIDTSTINHLTTDFHSTDSARRSLAVSLYDDLTDRSWVPFLTYHHFEEILAHEDDSKIDRVLAYLSTWGEVAYLMPLSTHPQVIGQISDLASLEFEIAACGENLPVDGIRNAVREHGFALAHSAAIVEDVRTNMPLLKPRARLQNYRSKELVAISAADFTGDKDFLVRDYLDHPERFRFASSKEVQSNYRAQREKLAQFIASRGDKALSDPDPALAETIAQSFMMETFSEAVADLKSGVNWIRQYLDVIDMPPEAVPHDMRLTDLTALVMFHRQIEGCCAFPPDYYRIRGKLRTDDFFSWVVQEGLRSNPIHLPRYGGSDLNDRHLAAFSAYVDFSLVDKRTMEHISQVARVDSHFSSICDGRFGKYRGTSRILNSLPSLPSPNCP